MKSSKFIRCKLSVSEHYICKFIDSDLTDANFNNCISNEVYFNGTELLNVIFKDCDLTGSHFTGANLTGAIFDNCNLTGSDFTGANLTNARFNDCVLLETNFTDATTDNTNFGNSLRVEDIIENQHEHHDGIAYEVHNTFIPFLKKRAKYLEIIDQPEPSFELANLDQYINDNFINGIKSLFPLDSIKLHQYTTLFTKFMPSLALMTDEAKILVAKSISFVFSQGDDFIIKYINVWLDESFNAYDGPGDNTSCVNGIIERLILSVINVAHEVCTDITKCNPKYEELSKLNRNFDINQLAKEWWLSDENIDKYTHEAGSGPDRRNAFITYLTKEATTLGIDDQETMDKIKKYADEIDDSQYERFYMGGRRKRFSRSSRKSKKSMKLKNTKHRGTKKRKRNSKRNVKR